MCVLWEIQEDLSAMDWQRLCLKYLSTVNGHAFIQSDSLFRYMSWMSNYMLGTMLKDDVD